MKADYAHGVSDLSPIDGMTPETLQETLLDLIALKHDDLMIISEYNPAIEMVKTG